MNEMTPETLKDVLSECRCPKTLMLNTAAEKVDTHASAWQADLARIEALKKAATEQAEDEALWFRAHTAPEACLQRALRRLHALIEGDTVMATLAEEKKP